MSPANERTSASLLGRLRNLEDQESWCTFEGRYRELILRYAMRRGLQPADAEDVRQTVFLGLTKTLRDYLYQPERGRFRDYLGTIVRNAVWRHLGRQNRGPELLSPDAPEPEAREDEAWSEEWRRHHYRRGMETLRASLHPGSLAIFEDLVEGVGAQQVAETHGVTPEVVYKVKQRVRERLAEIIQGQLADEEPDGSA